MNLRFLHKTKDNFVLEKIMKARNVTVALSSSKVCLRTMTLRWRYNQVMLPSSSNKPNPFGTPTFERRQMKKGGKYQDLGEKKKEEQRRKLMWETWGARPSPVQLGETGHLPVLVFPTSPRAS